MCLLKKQINLLKRLNRKRLFVQRIIEIKLRSRLFTKSQKQPCKIRKILLIEAQGSWGDSIYTLGLVKKFESYGCNVQIAVLPQSVKYYSEFVESVYELGNPDQIKECLSNNFDAVIDITYVNLKNWKERSDLLKKLDCYKCTCGDVAKYSPYFDDYIDISTESHQSKRMAKIIHHFYKDDNTSAIHPFNFLKTKSFDISECLEGGISNMGEEYIYVNCEAGEPDRCFSENQLQKILEILSINRKLSVLVYKKSKINCRVSKNIFFLKKIPFDYVPQIIKNAKAIITPDTSIVHLGGAFNIPILAFYCGNDRDYFSQYSMSQAWGPISKQSTTYSNDDLDINDGLCGVGHRVTSIRNIPICDIERTVRKFLNSLGKVADENNA